MSDAPPLKVLQVIDSLGMGGAETWLMEVLRLWRTHNGPRMDFLLTGGGRGIFDTEAKSLGAKLFYLPFNRQTLPQFVRAFRRVLRTEHYDAIHDHQAFASGWHFLAGHGVLPPVRVTHVHNPAYQIGNYYAGTLSRRVAIAVGKRLIARESTHIAGTSRQVLSEYGFDAPMFAHLSKQALHCGFAPERFMGDRRVAHQTICEEFNWPQDARIVLFAGRMDVSPDLGNAHNHKNSGFAVDVALAALDRDPKLCMLFAGKSQPDAQRVLEQRIEAAGATGKIVFGGIRNDIAHLMLGSDVLLFPSRGEGLGMVAVEAQAAGLPVLASTAVPRECVVVPELVHFMQVEAGAKAWADALHECPTLPGGAAAANCAVASSPFSIESSARALAGIYASFRAGPDTHST